MIAIAGGIILAVVILVVLRIIIELLAGLR